ncbi:MAG TPA: hypothetical protein ENI87_00030, partial [bacterium]|nr:hypothetical protein [bacterium]
MIPSRPSRIPLVAATAALALAGLLRTAGAQHDTTGAFPPLAPDRERGAASVDVAQCEKWLHTLAGPEFGGRGTGQDGYGKAAAFVAGHFADLGLEARGQDGSYFQHMPWTRTAVKRAQVTFSKGGKTLWAVPEERLLGRVGDDTDVQGEVLLLHVEVPPMRGRGLPKIEGMDAVDAEGKVVFALVHASGRAERFARFAVMRALSGKKVAALVFLDQDEVQGGLTGSSGARRGGRTNPAAAA